MEIKIKEDHTHEVLNELDKAVHRALEAIGMQAETNAKKELTKLKKHRWSDKTHPLIRGSVDSGTLRNSITHTVVDNEVHIGSNLEYASMVELGSSRSPAYPFLKPAIVNHKEEYRKILAKELKGEQTS